MELTILMPCLNESKTLKTCIDKAKLFLITHHIDGEILVADNGSTDGSQDIAKNLGARVVDIDEKGYGAALIGGCNAALGKYVIMGDSDDSYDFLNLMPFVEKLREGYELVMGNRFKGGIEPGAMPPLHRYIGNPVLSFIGRVLYKSDIKDFHCGLRGYNRESILKLNLHTTGMEYASEMVVQATLHKLKICEVPTTLRKDGRDRPPHLRSWSDGWRHLTFLLMHSPNWLFLYPGLIFFVIGLVFSIVLTIGPVTLGSTTFSINTLLYSAMSTILGLQLILFFVLTKKYAAKTKFIPITKFDQKLIKFTMNKGILIGACLLFLGIVGAIASVVIWSDTGFGNLTPEHMFRLTIPVLILIVCGIQLMFNSFFLGILEIRTKKEELHD